MSWAELHRFRGRLFVIGQWGVSGGRSVPDDVRPEALGRELARFLRPRPWHRSSDWSTFCREVAGVDERDYEPEVRISAVLVSPHVLVRPLGFAASPDREHEVQVAERDVTGVAEHALQLLRAARPRWPTVRSAHLLTARDGGLVVEVYGDAASSGSRVRVHRARTSASTLVDDVRGALALSPGRATGTLPVDGDVPDAETVGGAMVVIAEDSSGEVAVERWRPADGGWAPTGDDPIPCTWETLAPIVLRQLASMPSRHAPAGTLTGVGLGRKMAWLAVRDRDPAAVGRALNLSGLREVPWADGIAAAYKGGIFVSPPTSGWVLVVGMRTSGTDVAMLSSALSGADVLAFATHRVSDSASWAMARDGELVRSAEIADGAVVASFGEPTAAEAGLDHLDPEEAVMRVAAAWSLDPLHLDTTATSSTTGHLADAATP
jgi:hypothetical protein